MRNTLTTKPTKPRLYCEPTFEALEQFLRTGRFGTGRQMVEKGIGTGTRARLIVNPDDPNERFVRIYCYGKALMELAEQKPGELRFKINWPTPSDRYRIMQFLPEDVYCVSIRGVQTIVAHGMKLPIVTQKEYIYSDVNGLTIPTETRLS